MKGKARGSCSDPYREAIVHQGVIDPQHSLPDRPVLCCTHSMAFGTVLCYTNLVAAGQAQVASCQGGAAGSSYSVPVIIPLAWPCLYLTVLQEVLMRTLFLFDSKNDE